MLRARLFVRTHRGAGSADFVLKVRGFSPAPDVSFCQTPQTSNARPALSTPCPDLFSFHLTSGIDRLGRQFTRDHQGAMESSLPASGRSTWRAKPLDAPAEDAVSLSVGDLGRDRPRSMKMPIDRGFGRLLAKGETYRKFA